MPGASRPGDFDHDALFAAMDERRRAEDLSWTGLTRVIWEQSQLLNELRDDHPLSPAHRPAVDFIDVTRR